MTQGNSIFNPLVTKVVKGLEGKVILVYGSNSVGKTFQGARMEKPLILPFEDGTGALDGIPYMAVNDWRDFKNINRELTSPATVEKAKEMYKTIIFDEVVASARMCQEYICSAYKSRSIKDGNGGYGLWSEYENEFWREINLLTKAGYTVYFIAHQTTDKNTGQIIPKGDIRTTGVVRDLADFTIFLNSNGTDENGNVVNSSAYLFETEHYFARSRFPTITPYIQNYTAENLEKAIIEAIEKAGIGKDGKDNTITFEERQKKEDTKVDYDEVVEELRAIFMQYREAEKEADFVRIIEGHLGVGAQIKDTTKEQAPVLYICKLDLLDFLENNIKGK